MGEQGAGPGQQTAQHQPLHLAPAEAYGARSGLEVLLPLLACHVLVLLVAELGTLLRIRDPGKLLVEVALQKK